MKLGNKLKMARQKMNMTQEEVANILHVSRSTISSWEVNRTYPDLDLLVDLSDLYELSLDDLLREEADLVENIVSINKKSQSRKRWIVVLLGVIVSIALLLVFFLFSRNTDVSYGQVKNISVELNGESLNPKSEVVIQADFDHLHEYSGYILDGNTNLSLSLMQSFDWSKKTLTTIRIPLGDMASDHYNDIEEIQFIDSSGATIIYSKGEGLN